MKNLFITVTIVLTASLSWAQTKTTSLYASVSPNFNQSGLYALLKDNYAQNVNANTETPRTDSAKADPEKVYTPDSAANETVKQFAFSQGSASHYLVGTWTINDTTNHLPPMSLTFDDSMHVKLLVANEAAEHLTYSVDMYHNQVVLHFEGFNSRHAKKHMYWFIKVLDDKTIEAEQPFYGPRSYKWNESIARTAVKQS
jgi:hypothetical protein